MLGGGKRRSLLLRIYDPQKPTIVSLIAAYTFSIIGTLKRSRVIKLYICLEIFNPLESGELQKPKNKFIKPLNKTSATEYFFSRMFQHNQVRAILPRGLYKDINKYKNVIKNISC